MSHTGFISSAMVTYQAARAAKVHWLPGARLVPEVIQIAERMGFTSDEMTQVGELVEDLHADGAIFRRGSVVIPDESGLPAGLFGWDTPGAVEHLTVRTA